MIRLGIDFGTANTVVCTWNDDLQVGEPLILEGLDQVRIGQIDTAERVIPSVCAFSKTSKASFFGAQVPRPQDRNPDLQVFKFMKSVATNRVANIPHPIFERQIRPKDAASEFLKQVIGNALLAVDDPDVELVLTAPIEAFDEYRDWLLHDVAQPLGLTRLRIVDEATAAAVGYAAKLSPDDPILVFDFGAGTLDITVVVVEKGVAGTLNSGVRTIAKRGADLGGKHIDTYLIRSCVEYWQIPSGDTRLLKEVQSRLTEEVERAKVELTLAIETLISIEHPESGILLSRKLTRIEFEKILDDQDFLGKVSRTLRSTLDEAASKGIKSEDLKAIFMVGGTSLVPSVGRIVRQQFPPERVFYDNPLEAVARGAASVAGGRELNDYIQHDYAIRHIDTERGGYEFPVIVKAGSTYPSSGSIFTKNVRATYDGQIQLGIQIYEIANRETSESSSNLEMQFDIDGGLRLVSVSAQQKEEKRSVWLNEKSPTFLEANPPAKAFVDRFRVDFGIDDYKRLTVSAFDLDRSIWVLTNQPVIRLV
jgi:molecular chaperone DnaK (HSP70)